MASLTRTELKDIVKECIIEVLLEGLRADEQPSQRVQRESVRQQPPKKHLDSMTFATGASRVAEQAQGRRNSPPPVSADLVASFPKDQRDVMQQIFEDTARTTLPTQVMADRSPNAAMGMQADAATGTSNIDPMSIFDGASNWADLAFASSKKK
jgi:hypothetical protein